MPRLVPLWIVLMPVVLLAQSPDRPQWVVTVDPACPVVSNSQYAAPAKEMRISYFPASGKAKLKDPKSLQLEIAFNGVYWPDHNGSFAFIRRNQDVWDATVPLNGQRYYAIFLVKDEVGRIDNNDGRYWEVLTCDPTGERNAISVGLQAATYEGRRLGPGIERLPDYSRAIQILEAGLPKDGELPNAWGQNLIKLWEYRVKRDGATDGAYASQAKEIAQYVEDHKDNLDLLGAVAGYVSMNPSRFPASLLEQAFKAVERLNPKAGAAIRESAEYNGISQVRDPRAQAHAMASFMSKYPASNMMETLLTGRFMILRQVGDVPGAEEAFQKRLAFDPDNPDTYAAMAAVYIEKSQKLDQALHLLDQAQERANFDITKKPGSHAFNLLPLFSPGKTEATLAHWRAVALLKLKRSAEAQPFAEQAARTLSDADSYYALARIYEDLSKSKEAVDAYLQSVTLPTADHSAAMRRLTALFVGGGMGSQDDLNARIMSLRTRHFQDAAYVPQIIDRQPPEFSFQTLSGESLRPADLKGKTVILNFWSTWCGPCLAELPEFLELQKRHPELAVAAIAINSPSKDVAAVVAQKALSGLRIVDAQSQHDAFGIEGVPITFVLDGNGHLRIVHDSGMPDVVAYVEQDLKALQNELTLR